MNDARTGSSLQLALEFPHRAALGLEDFFVSESNRAAIELIDRWPRWPGPCAYLQGPAGSGKSHLAHVWQMASDARIVSAADVDARLGEGASDLAALVVEDVDKALAGDGAGKSATEHELFHLINLAKEHEFHVLFTGAAAPGQIEIALPDLRSRMRALPVVRIEAPDEMLLRTVMAKQFGDRQIDVQPNLIEYILPRMERSFEGVGELVELLDRSALESGRRITRQFAGEILRQQERRGQTDGDSGSSRS